ncbi:hypothetical protein Tco_0831793 [Tanacetum coccineum]
MLVKALACWVWKPKYKVLDNVSKHNSASITIRSLIMLMHKADPVSDGLGYPKEMNFLKLIVQGNPQMDLQDKGVVDSGCLRHMIGNMSYLTGYKEIDGGYVAFGGNPKGGKITGKGTIKTGNLDFENVYFVQKHVMMQVKLEWRQYLAKIIFCYHCGLLIHHSLKLQRLLMLVSNLQEMNSKCRDQEKEDNVNNTNNVNAASTNEVNAVGGKSSIELPDDLNMPTLEGIVYSDDDEDVGAEADMNNLDAFIPVSPIPTTIVYKNHPVE